MQIANLFDFTKEIAVEFSTSQSKVHSIKAISEPDLIIEAEVLSPSEKLSASIIIDFPAPVSPVITVKPGLNDISILSIIAKFLILSRVRLIVLFTYKFTIQRKYKNYFSLCISFSTLFTLKKLNFENNTIPTTTPSESAAKSKTEVFLPTTKS